MPPSLPVRHRARSTTWRSALPVFFAASVLTIFSWRAMVQREHRQMQHLVDVGARRIRSEVLTSLATRMGTLSILAREWQGRLFPTRSGWESDVRLALSQSPGLEAVEWIEPGGQVDWVYPRGARLPPLGLAKLQAERRPLGQAFLAGPFALAEGRPAFRILAPLVESGQVAGWLSGSFRASKLFAAVVEDAAPSYEILLRSGDVDLARSAGFGAAPQRPFTRQLVLDPPGPLPLTLDVQPSPQMIRAARSNLPLVILAGGLAMSVLLAAALALRGLAAARAREVEVLNRELEERVAARTAELARSNEDLEQFASFLSHELRRPISAHTIWADLLQSRYAAELGDPFRTYVEEIRSGARHISELISAQLELCAADARDPEGLPVDLSSVVLEVGSELKADLERSGAMLQVEALPVVRIDVRQFRQLVRNLLENAIKFRRPEVPPRIEVSFAPRSDRRADAMEIRFRDNGRGFPADQAERIFALSERLENDDEPGSGLGLALCRRIAARLGGEIHAEGTPGVGATFHLLLPRSRLVDDPVREA